LQISELPIQSPWEAIFDINSEVFPTPNPNLSAVLILFGSTPVFVVKKKGSPGVYV
jgi:hypothetical protein